MFILFEFRSPRFRLIRFDVSYGEKCDFEIHFSEKKDEFCFALMKKIRKSYAIRLNFERERKKVNI